MNVYLRWMIRRDMPEVLDIERASAFEYPWPEEQFIRCLRQRNCIGMVVDICRTCGRPTDRNCGRCHGHELQVVGFMIYELHKRRLDVLNFAVHPELRRQGIGRAMLHTLRSKLSANRRWELRWHVAEPNLAGQLFLRHHGFRACGIVREHYDRAGDWANAIDMRYLVPIEVCVHEQ